MLQFHSYKIENVTPQKTPTEAHRENVTNPESQTRSNTAHYRLML